MARRALLRWFVALLASGSLGCCVAVPAANADDPVIAASGDISCGANSVAADCQQAQTANILASMSPLDAVLPLGDLQYECGELSNFNNFYDPTWGRFRSITRPAIGNHEYQVPGSSTNCLGQGPGAPGYFSYFGSSIASPLDPGCTSACKGYYSYNLGTWHLIALNSNCLEPGVGGCSPGSPQYTWLQNDLSLWGAMKNCILAYWHQPRYSSGGRQGSQTQPLWELLYDAGADVVLTGHDHVYERFDKLGRGTAAAVDPVADPNGIREWVVGVGGRSFTSWSTIRAQSEVRNNSAFGVLKLTLHYNGYDWQFLPVAGSTFTDLGSSACNGPPVESINPPSGGGGPPVVSINPPSGGGGHKVTLSIGKLTIDPVAFRVAPSPPWGRSGRQRRYGATVGYVLSEQAVVRFTVVEPEPGRRDSRGACLQPMSGRRKAPRCTRLIVLGRFTRSGRRAATFHFSGWPGRHRLAPGTYQLIAVPTVGGRAGRGASVRFTVIR